MLNKFVRFVLAQPVFVLVMTVALAAFGINAVMHLPIEAFPDVQDVQVQIITLSPGSAPEEVERTLTLPIEREMTGVPGETQLRSVSMTGLSVVTLTFADGTDNYFARSQVLEHLGNVTLPTGVQPTLAPLTTAVGEVVRYVVQAPPDMAENDVRALQDWVVRPALRMVPGVADVASFGGTVKEYQVLVDPARLKRFGVTLDQVALALTNNSANVGGGVLRRGDEALVVRSIGLVDSLASIGQVIVQAKQGRTVLVSDIAQVELGHKPRSGIVAYDDHDSVVEGVVSMTKGQNAAVVVAGVEKAMAALALRLPPGAALPVVYKRTDLIHQTVDTVVENLVTGALLVIVILVVFLRNWRAAVIVATVIPLSLLFAFIMLDLRGIPANLISLGAVDFGIIIDSAVVLVEALMVRLALDRSLSVTAPAQTSPRPGAAHQKALTFHSRLRVLRETVVDLGRPILFSKGIIIIAFLPIFTFQRVEGKIFAPVAFTLTFALLGALVLTVTLVPTLLRFAMRGANMAERRSQWMENLQSGYQRLLLWGGVRRVIVFTLSLVVLGATLLLAPLLGSEFLPKLDEGNIWLTITLPTSTAIDTTKQVERKVRAVLRSYPEVRRVITQVGRPDDGTDAKGPNNLEILADLQPRSQWNFADKQALVEDMTRRLKALPGVPTNFSQVIEDNVEESLSGVKGEIAVKIYGPDLQVLEKKSEQIAAVLRGLRGAADVAAIRIGGQSEVDIQVDRRRLARLGISVADVNTVIASALGDVAVNSFYEGDRRFDVTMQVAKGARSSIDDIGALQVNLPDGAGTVSLDQVAHIALRQGASRVSREGGERNASVKANLLGRDQGSFIDEAQQAVAAQVVLPPGYRITWGGQFENQQRAVKRLAVIVPISALLIFSLLFWAFGSVRYACLVLVLVPFTLIGGIAGLAIAGLHFSVSAAVGFIAVAGISVQNGVIMVEHIADNLDASVSLFENAVTGAVARLRPILMTALMAGLGLLPAALSHGIGSETQRPFAVVIVGGVVSATLFTLLLLPLLYPIFAGGKQKRQEDFEPAVVPAPAPVIPGTP
ncbi:efflux RND transporter permease subunit [Variovorax sp. PAMC28562]|uniref:efflux RND transporter permease subunit n=1 Tax=Variovorax sp. PAMC28562 TaxID=2762323 RepID=UPI00164DC42E|nr:CusA/CzcA family heavy metal efflux RND transporter [Variovorax sp. PAMC28562]QNK71845.1 efflux RND transporter permease subunit [Variovorax sp. PAMC28562]